MVRADEGRGAQGAGEGASGRAEAIDALRRSIVARIRARGPMPFAAFMSLALYDRAHGYYAGGEPRAGWRGDFLTSPELDRAYGELWARAFERAWEACGRPAPFHIVEVGPGEGGFAEAVLSSVESPFASRVRYHLVERVASFRARQQQRLARFDNLRWIESLPEASRFSSGVVFANEVLDNLPVHVVERHHGDLFEVCIDAPNDQLVESLRPLEGPEIASYLRRAELEVREGHRVEVGLAAESFVRRASGLFERGALFVVDYGLTSQQLAERPRGTLVAYSTSGVDDELLARPGDKDITAHVNWTALENACISAGLDVRRSTQREFLRALGIAELHQALQREHQQAIAAGRGADAVGALSRRQALGALTDPGGLGGLGVLIGERAKGAEHGPLGRR